MAIKKKFLKTKNICKCTFSVPKKAAPHADTVTLVGDFNQWRADTHPLKRLKNGDFKIQLNLETGRKYQYKYLIDNEQWENDWQADEYVIAPEFKTENSVVALVD